MIMVSRSIGSSLGDKYKPMQRDIKVMPAGDDTLAEAALKYLVTHSYPAVKCGDR